jgi:hypothetical protein
MEGDIRLISLTQTQAAVPNPTSRISDLCL